MSQETALRDILRLLAKLDIEYMLTGSYASNIYGRARSTFDADVVIALVDAQLKRLLVSLGKDFYVDAENMRDAREAGGQFNAIHRPTGLKIDFYLAQDERDRTALRRRKTFPIWNTRISVIAPEDLMLAKLAWARKGESGRQIEDARGIYEVQKGDLDIGYLKSEADRLGLKDLLDRAGVE